MQNSHFALNVRSLGDIDEGDDTTTDLSRVVVSSTTNMTLTPEQH